jgi:hypothetical protein
MILTSVTGLKAARRAAFFVRPCRLPNFKVQAESLWPEFRNPEDLREMYVN